MLLGKKQTSKGKFNTKLKERVKMVVKPRLGKKVVWYANKKGAYLYGSKAMSKYYSAHH